MNLKRWNEYTAEEKETILMHYFTYYGKTFITLSELELYHDLCKTNPDLIFNYIKEWTYATCISYKKKYTYKSIK